MASHGQQVPLLNTSSSQATQHAAASPSSAQGAAHCNDLWVQLQDLMQQRYVPKAFNGAAYRIPTRLKVSGAAPSITIWSISLPAAGRVLYHSRQRTWQQGSSMCSSKHASTAMWSACWQLWHSTCNLWCLQHRCDEIARSGRMWVCT